MSEPVVSVIVPIYNAEKFLAECVESILNQTYENIEVILIDNGSTDKTPQICDGFKARDNRVRVIHKIHGSISSGRNAGLEVAQGEYITFVDSDDILEKEMIKILLETAIDNDADIGICKAKRMYIDHIEELEETESVAEYTVPQAIHAWQCAHIFGNEVWAKIYKRQCIKDVIFPERTCEDICFLFDAICNAKKIVSIDKRLYYYRMHRLYEEQSAYRRPVEDDKVQVLEEILETVKSKYNEIYEDMFGASCDSILSSVMRIYAAEKVKEQKVYLDNSYSFFLRNYCAIKESEKILKRNKKIITLFLNHRKMFGLIFKIRNYVKEQ